MKIADLIENLKTLDPMKEVFIYNKGDLYNIDIDDAMFDRVDLMMLDKVKTK